MGGRLWGGSPVRTHLGLDPFRGAGGPPRTLTAPAGPPSPGGPGGCCGGGWPKYPRRAAGPDVLRSGGGAGGSRQDHGGGGHPLRRRGSAGSGRHPRGGGGGRPEPGGVPGAAGSSASGAGSLGRSPAGGVPIPRLDGASSTIWRSPGPFPPGRLDHVLVSGSSLEILRSFAFDPADLREEALDGLGLRRKDGEITDHLPLVVDLRMRR